MDTHDSAVYGVLHTIFSIQPAGSPFKDTHTTMQCMMFFTPYAQYNQLVHLSKTHTTVQCMVFITPYAQYNQLVHVSETDSVIVTMVQIE
jgi:hypothetical protein